MSKLIFMFDGNVIGEFELNKERMSIGRRPNNDIHIDNLAVSGEHAVVITLGNDSFLEDLNSTNGTFVNKKRIKKHSLQNQDVIELGKYQLKFVGVPNVSVSKSDGFVDTLIPTMISSPAKIESEPAVMATVVSSLDQKKNGRPVSMQLSVGDDDNVLSDNVPATSATLVDNMPEEKVLKEGRIKVIDGVDVGVEIYLNKTMMKLGKHGVQLAVVTKRTDGYYITHVDGKTKALVNGKAIGVHAQQLVNGDIIEIAGDKMQFSDN